MEEIQAGDLQEAKKRLKSVAQIPRLEITKAALDLAKQFVSRKILPQKATKKMLFILQLLLQAVWIFYLLGIVHILRTLNLNQKFQNYATKMVFRVL